MTYSIKPPLQKGAVLGGQDKPFSTYCHSEKSLKLYDKHARSVSEMFTDDRSRLHDFLTQSEIAGYTLVQASVKGPESLEVTASLRQGVILALDESRGMVLHRQQGGGHLAMYAILQQVTDCIKIAAIAPHAQEEIRSFMRQCYAGWHHQFHEVIASAAGFSVAHVQDTKVDELIQLIQVPSRFPE